MNLIGNKALRILKGHESFQVTSHALKCRPTVGYNMLITCEHGGTELPPGRPWHASDLRLKETHWSTDIGAGDFARDLSSRIRVPALVHNFSRLIIDVNRPLDSPTLFRDIADGIPIELNQGITATERQRRIDRYYRPYHEELSYLTNLLNPSLILSLHSFTDNYEGKTRDVEVGVLFNEHENLALEFEAFFREKGYKVKLNEPWSGKEGFMYAVSQVESEENKGIMLEFRQDLLLKEEWRLQLLNNLENLLTTKLGYLRYAESSDKIKKGDTIPEFTFSTIKNGTPTTISTNEIFQNKKVVLFAVPGAFTPGCSQVHFPSFVKNFDKFKAKGIDIVACTSINDVYVMDAWAKSQGGQDKILMLADGNGDFARLIGMLQSAHKVGLGLRSKRYAMLVNNGKVNWIGVDSKDINYSKAETVLDNLD